jgi:hypothetical protein
VVITDDLDGSQGAETVAFGLDGVSYEIDLAATVVAAAGSFAAVGTLLGSTLTEALLLIEGLRPRRRAHARGRPTLRVTGVTMPSHLTGTNRRLTGRHAIGRSARALRLRLRHCVTQRIGAQSGKTSGAANARSRWS